MTPNPDRLFFYDFETTGLPIWDRRSSDPRQPRVIQMAALVTDTEGNKLSAIDCLIKPEGWTVPPKSVELTGITTALCEQGGIGIDRALSIFIGMWRPASVTTLRIAHNEAFDSRMVRIEIARSPLPWATDVFADSFKEAPHYCTQVKARPICKLPMPSGKAGNKVPKLTEAYQFFAGEPHENAHQAFGDLMALKYVYFAIQAHEGGPGEQPTEPESFVDADPLADAFGG